MFSLRMTVAVLIVASALLGSIKAEGQFQANELLQTLTNLIASSSLEQRCATYEQTIKSFLPAGQQATTSKDELYSYLMSEAESRKALNEDEKRVLDDIKHCFDFNSAPESISSLPLAPTSVDVHDTDSNNNQHQDEALLRQLERDLAGEKSRAFERERGIDGLLRKVIRKAGEKASNKLRVKFDEFRRDISSIMTKFINAYGEPFGRRHENVKLTNERVGQFKNVMKGQLEKVLDNMDLLKTEQGQDDQQYADIKEGFRQLESELGRFIQSQSPVYPDVPSRTEFARLTDAQLGEFQEMLERQLGAALKYIGHIEQSQERLIEQPSSDRSLLRQLERDLAGEKSRAFERERGIDGLLRKVIRKVGKKALNKLRVKFDEFRRDISGIITKFINAYGEAFGQRRENVKLINERVGQFKNVMKGQLEKVLDNMDLLKTEQGQDDQQYADIKEGFRQLESELGRFIQSQSPVYPDVRSRTEFARLTDAQLGEFHRMLERQLYAASEYIGHQELHG